MDIPHHEAMEIYRDRLILYGCGDFNDYEGIEVDEYRGRPRGMASADIDPTNRNAVDLELVPLQTQRTTPSVHRRTRSLARRDADRESQGLG
jgi:poly-gamma-glutamate synthesis protein (capsule biosynthesis protein)